MSSIRVAAHSAERRSTFLLLSIALLLSVLATATWAQSAQDPVGRVIRTLGVVEAVGSDGSVRRLRRQDPIFEGDALRTGERGRAQIRFTDRGLMSLRPSTELAVDDYEFNERTPTTARQSLTLRRGGFRAATGRVADGNRAGYRVNTPLAVIGVRGTVWKAEQTPGGPLVLGVEDGGIDATTSTGRTARLGVGAGFNFARVNSDGSVDYLVEPPAELSTSAELDEGEDEGDDGGDDGGSDDGGSDGGDGGDEGGDLGDAGESSVGSGEGSEATSTSGASEGAASAVVSVGTNPESTGAVNESQTGDGDLPTEEPIPGIDPITGLLPAEVQAVVADSDAGVVTSLQEISVGSGVASVSADTGPIFSGTRAGAGFATGIQDVARQTVVDTSEVQLGSQSGEASFTENFRGIPGLTWGSYTAPVTIFSETFTESADGVSTRAFETIEITEEVLFAFGTPTEIATLTGSSFYRSSGIFDVRTSGLTPLGVSSEATLNFGNGALDGILDVQLQDGTDSAAQTFAYIVDFEGVVRGGLLQDTVITDGRFVETTGGLAPDENTGGDPISATISGFVTGSFAEFLQLGFAYSTEARADAAVSGLVLLDTPRLLPAEQTALSQGFFFVGAFGPFNGGVAGGRAVDARLNGGNTLLSFVNLPSPIDVIDPSGPSDSNFLDLPPDFIVRNGRPVGQLVTGLTAPGTDTLAAVVWQGDDLGLDFAGEPLGTGVEVIDAASGDPFVANLSFNRVHFITGQPTGIANLTGAFNYGGAELLTGEYFPGGVLANGTTIGDIEFGFDVDFMSGAITNGFLALFDGPLPEITDGQVSETDPTAIIDLPQLIVSTSFSGQVGGSGAVNGADIDLLSGSFFQPITEGVDGGIDSPGLGDPIDLENSEIGGFFAGATGEAFAGAFQLIGSTSGNTAMGSFYAQRGEPLLPLTSEEATQLAEGFGYVQSVCCFEPAPVVLQGRITDPRTVGAPNVVFGFGDVDPFDSLFNEPVPVGIITRPDEGDIRFFDTFDIFTIDPETGEMASIGADISVLELAGASNGPDLPGGPIGIYDAASGRQLDQIQSNLLSLSGRIADIADLTGRARYSLAGAGGTFAQGFYVVQSGGADSFVDVDPSFGSDIAFNVDFGTGEITNGFLRLFTDAEEAGTPFDQAFMRDRVDVGFEGAVALSNGNPFASLFVSAGFVTDADGDTGGSGLIDPTLSDIGGFFAGDGSVFNLAFSLQSMQDPENPSDFLSPVAFTGAAVLGREELAISAAEAAQLAEGRIFLGLECCAPDGGVSVGLAGDPANVDGDVALTDGRFILALNVDANGEGLRPGDPGVLDSSVEEVARIGNAFGTVTTNVAAPPGSELVLGAWTSGASQGVRNQPLLADAITGEILDVLDDTVLFNVGTMATVADLQANGAFLTFSGASNEGFLPSEGLPDGFRTLGGFGQSNVFDLDPNLAPIAGSSVSFNVDLATGEVFNGSLFALTEIDSSAGFAEEFGFQVFFNGQLNYANGNAILDAQITGGVFDENVALDLTASDLNLFLVGSESAGFYTANGAYFLQSVVHPEFGETVQLAGTFNLGRGTFEESRLSNIDASALNGGRLGIATYSFLDDLGNPAGVDVVGGRGFLLGRANTPTGSNFLLGANYYRNKQAFDPTTLNPLFETNGDPVLEQATTARRGFFAQPYDFVVRRDGITAEVFETDALPDGGLSLPGFEVSWGLWLSDGTTGSVEIQDDPTDPGSLIQLDRTMLFASVNPTPQSQMPVTGVFNYSANCLSACLGILGVGSGSILGSGESVLETIDASFDLDFSTGVISNGTLATEYLAVSSIVRWDAGFGGFVNGAIADLELSSLALTVDGMASGFTGDLANSSIGGIFTGPAAERFVGGFNFQATDDLTGSSFESAHGLFILDQFNGITDPNLTPLGGGR